MPALAKALLLIARSFRRMAGSMERIEALYRLELRTQGIFETDPSIKDEVEVSYGVKVTNPDDPEPWDQSK